MQRITIANDPARVSDIEVYDVQDGTILLDWLISHFGPDGFSVPVSIFRGCISQLSEIDQKSFDAMNAPIFEPVYIVKRPQGTFVAQLIWSIVIAVAVAALMPTPRIPNNNQREARKSPNNQVFGQTNIARLLERVPDIFGTEKSYPDIIAPTVFEYINHEKFLTDYMCITRGFVEVSDIKTGDTPIADIAGSDVEFFPPGDYPAQLLRSQESNEVKGQVLKGPNEGNFLPVTSDPVFYDSDNDLAYMMSNNGEAFNSFTIGGVAILKNTYLTYFDGVNTEFAIVDGNYTIDNIQDWNYLTPITFAAGISFAGGDELKTIVRSGIIYAPRFTAFPFTTTASWPTMSAKFFEIANLSGFANPITYAAGISFLISDTLKTIMRDGIIYKPVADRLPFTTSGSWSTDQFLFSSIINLQFKAMSLLDAAVVNTRWDDPSPFVISEQWYFFAENYVPTVTPQGAVFPLGPFAVPGDSAEQVWIDIQAPNGLARGSNLNSVMTVELSFKFEETDIYGAPTGPYFWYNISVADNDRSPRFWTFKVAASDGLDPSKTYRVTGYRVTNSKPTSLTQLDEIQWSRLAGITDISAPDNTGTTRVMLKTRATEQVAALQEKKLNMIVTRRVVTWDGSAVVGDMVSGTDLVASNRVADCLLHYMLDPRLGQRNISNVDAATLYAIQAQLDAAFDGEKGEFSFTFDSKTSPALEEMIQITSAARIFMTREGAFFSFIRDQAQSVPRMLFNRRNKLPEQETKSIRFNKPNDSDGITLEYIDNRDYKPRTITLPDDLPVGDPNYGMPATENPMRIETTGVKNYAQAWDRSQYEFNRLIYKRVSIKSEVTYEAVFLPLNSRVLHIDGTRLDYSQSDGEITGISGQTIATDNRCVFEVGKTYSVFLRDEDGGLSVAQPVTARTDGSEFGFELTNPAPFALWIRGDSDYQRGTLWSFAEDGTSELADSYIVQRKSPRGHASVELEMINYAAEYYQADNQTPPPKA